MIIERKKESYSNDKDNILYSNNLIKHVQHN